MPIILKNIYHNIQPEIFKIYSVQFGFGFGFGIHVLLIQGDQGLKLRINIIVHSLMQLQLYFYCHNTMNIICVNE